MDAYGFLRFIWPESGYYCIATPGKTSGYVHHTYKTIEEAAAKAMQLDEAGRDVFYCMSTLAESKVVSTQKDGSEKIQYRVKSNLYTIQTLFFELDVAKPDESESRRAAKFESREVAVQKLKEFCINIGWPPPTVVSSGWGLHIYYPLLSAVKTHDIEPVMHMLKRAARVLGFNLDMNAADITRVFRVVGTHNYKRDPQPVELLRKSNRYDLGILRGAIESALLRIGESVPTPSSGEFSGDNPFGESNLAQDYPAIRVEGLMACPTIKAVVDAKGDVPYDHWWRVGQVVRFAEDGRQHFHDMSSGSSDYDYDYTEQVLDRFEHNNIGPTLCDTFASHVSYCKDCRFNGKIKSPISLGRAAVSTSPPTVEHIDSTGAVREIEVSAAPYPYVRTGRSVVLAVTNKDGETKEVEVASYDLFPVRRVYNETERREYISWRAVLPREGAVDLLITASDMYDRRALASALVNSGIYVTYSNLDALRDYMVAYIRVLQEAAQKDKLISRLGWREDHTKFVYGRTIYSATGNETCEVESGSRVSTAIRSSGTLDEWKKIADVYSTRDFVAHQLAFATAFGAPLMAFTDISGGVINLLGISGEGKSSVQRLVNSVWGHPQEMMMPAEGRGSTYRAKIGYLTAMGNLAVCAEEITDMEPKDLGALIYSVNQGSDGWTMTQDRKLRASAGLWQLIMLSSSNSSIVEKLTNLEGAAAKTLRVMEMRLPMVDRYTKNEFQARFDQPLRTNYGVAGSVYAQYLVDHLDEVKAMLSKVMAKLDAEMDIKAEERVWSAMIAANVTGIIIARECGLVTYDPKAVYAYAKHMIENMRNYTQDTHQTAAEILAEYLNEMQQGMLVVDEPTHVGKSAVKVITRPTRSIVGRYDMRSGLAWVAELPFKQWCIRKGLVFSDTTKELMALKVAVKTKNIKRVLGAGTEYRTGQVKCLIIDTLAVAFGGTTLALVHDTDVATRQDQASSGS